MKTVIRSKSKYDALGMGISIACLVHCLIPPALVLLLGLSEASHSHSIFNWHTIFLVGALIAVIFASRNANKIIVAGLWISIIGFAYGVFSEPHTFANANITTISSIGLVFFHLLNFRRIHQDYS